MAGETLIMRQMSKKQLTNEMRVIRKALHSKCQEIIADGPTALCAATALADILVWVCIQAEGGRKEKGLELLKDFVNHAIQNYEITWEK